MNMGDVTVIRIPAAHLEVNKKTGKRTYTLDEPVAYRSRRYDKWVVIPRGYRSDGASGPATDVASLAWWLHDKLCDDKRWADGTPITRLQRSQVLADILRDEGRAIRAVTWFLATFLFESFP